MPLAVLVTPNLREAARLLDEPVARDEAEMAVKDVLFDWAQLSKQARACAVEVFDSAKNLRKILDL